MVKTKKTEARRCHSRAVYSLFLLIPVLIFTSSWYLRTASGPYYEYNFDPEYCYFLNALSILDGEVPGHTDHPGTTLQILGAATIAATDGLQGSEPHRASGDNRNLSFPEFYLLIINILLNVAVFLTVYMLGAALYRATESTALSLASQLSLLGSYAVFDSLPRVTPEPLLIATSLLLVCIFARCAITAQPMVRPRLQAVFIGIAIGFGLTTKVTFFPLVLYVLLLPTLASIVVAICVSVGTFAALTYPIWPAYSSMWGWFAKLATKSGQYGSGKFGLPTADFFFANLWKLVGDEPMLFLSLIACLIVYFAQRHTRKQKRSHRFSERFLLISVAVLIVHIFLTARHSPSGRYLVPTIAFSALPIAFFLHFILSHPRLRTLLWIPTVALLVLSALLNIWRINRDFVEPAEQRRAELSEVSHRLAEHGCRPLEYYRAGSRAFALHFGNGCARKRFSSALKQRYPSFLSYNVWARQIEDMNYFLAPESVAALQARHSLCLIGSVELPYQGAPRVEQLHSMDFYKIYKLLPYEKVDSVVGDRDMR